MSADVQPPRMAGPPPPCVQDFVALAERSLAGDHKAIDSDAIADVLTAAIRLYAARAEATETFPPPVDTSKATATDVLVVVSELIRAIDANMFDVSMWHGRRVG
jgi:hypothetical protein